MHPGRSPDYPFSTISFPILSVRLWCVDAQGNRIGEWIRPCFAVTGEDGQMAVRRVYGDGLKLFQNNLPHGETTAPGLENIQALG